MDLSLVIPLYNEDESIPELTAWIDRVCKQNSITYEAILVDDGSTDNSWEVLKSQQAKNPNIKGIRFRRNYGKSAALNQGFEAAEGRVVITMDADLQDNPDEIPPLFKMIEQEGFDLVSGWKQKRHDPIGKTLPSKFFNRITRMITGIKLNDFNCGLKAYRKEVIKSIDVYGEMHRYIPALAKAKGFAKIGEKVVQHKERKYGVTKFGLERYMKGFLDLLTLMFTQRFASRPMHLFGTIGTLSFLFGGGVAIWLIVQKLISIARDIPYREVTDQPLFYIALIMVVLGMQLFLAGFLGEMIYQNHPQRGRYEIAEKI